MLEAGNAPEGSIRQIKEAAAAAQQEARFAILALSSASGNAPFDAALRRYVDFLTADGELEVDLDVDPGSRSRPMSRSRSSGSCRKDWPMSASTPHAGRAEVVIGQRGNERVVVVRDDGAGFDGEADPAGQGLKNLRQRAAAIGGAFSLRSAPTGHRAGRHPPRVVPCMRSATKGGRQCMRSRSTRPPVARARPSSAPEALVRALFGRLSCSSCQKEFA